MLRHMIAAAALVGVAGVGAQEIGIKDFQLGGDLRAEAAKAGLKCGPSPIKDSAAEWCQMPYNSKQTLGGIEVESLYLAGFDNKLGSIYYRFKETHFGLIRDALREKFPGMKCEDSTVKTRAGATFDQTVCTYETAKAVLTLERRGPNVTTSGLDAFTKDYDRAWEADRKRRTGEAKKDI